MGKPNETTYNVDRDQPPVDWRDEISSDPWYRAYSCIVGLAEWLIDTKGWREPQVLKYLQRPWEYQREWLEFQRSKASQYPEADVRDSELPF